MATKLKILLFVILALAASILGAQEPDIVSFNGRGDFPVSQINHIKQDRFGYIWIASAQGLYRFDGTRFVRIAPDAGLATKNIVALYADADSSIWASAIDCETWNIKRNNILGHYKTEEYSYKRAPINATYRKNHDTLVFQTYGRYTIKLTADSVAVVRPSTRGDLLEGLLRRLDKRWNLQFVYFLQLKLDTLMADPRFRSGNITVANDEDNACIYYGNLLISATFDSIGARFTANHVMDQKQVNGTTFESLYGKGLVVRYKKTGATDTLLKHFQVTSIFIDDNRGVWIGTKSRGLFYIRNFLVRNFPSVHFHANVRYNDIATFGDTLLLLANRQLFMLNTETNKTEQLLSLPFVAHHLHVLQGHRLVLMGIRQIALVSKINDQWKLQNTLTNIDDVNYSGAFYRRHFYTIGLKGIHKHNLNDGKSSTLALKSKRIRFLAVANDQLYAANDDSLWVFAHDKIVNQISLSANSYFGSDGVHLFTAYEGGKIDVLKGLTDTLSQVRCKETVRDVFAFDNKLFISSFNGVEVHGMDSANHSQTQFFDASCGLRSSSVKKSLHIKNKLVFLHDAGVAISPDTLFRPFKEFNLDVNASGKIKKTGQRIQVDIGQNTNHLQIKFSTFHFERLLRDELFYRVENDSVWYSMTNNEMSLVN
ncbi:MAG: hypothetical protein R6U85_14375, partial [Salinivirgaceae bacterium]